MPRTTFHGNDYPDPAMLEEVAAALDDIAGYRRADAVRAALGAAVLRGGDAEPLGGEAARARLATLTLRLLALPEDPFSPADAARFLYRGHGYLDQPPIDLMRTVVGAEQVRRLVEHEPPLPPPDPTRIAGAAELDDLTIEEAFGAYAEDRIGSPRLMAITGLRSIGAVMGALTQRHLQLPHRPTLVGPGRDDRDLLWEHMGGREEPALQGSRTRYPRPTPAPSPALDAAWPTVAPDDATSRQALAGVAAALDAEAGKQERQAMRAVTAAAGLRSNAEAVGGEAARARLLTWTVVMMERGEGDEHRAPSTAWFLLQKLRNSEPLFTVLAGGDGALELARTAEGAALVDRWLTLPPGPDPARVVAATDLDDLTPEEAWAAYADGRIDSRRLMAVTGVDHFFEVWGQLALRGLKLPVVPTFVAPDRDDRDLLWESMAGSAEEAPSPSAEEP